MTKNNSTKITTSQHKNGDSQKIVDSPIYLPLVIIVSGFIGLISSFMLAVETVEYIKDPTKTLACNINPIVSCSSVIDTPQGQIFGFMNPLLGVVAFSMLIVFGFAIFYKTKFPKWIWLSAQFVSLLGILFVHWLIFSSIYVLGSLCPYCMVVWLVTMPIAIYITLANAKSGMLGKSSNIIGHFLSKFHITILLVWYAIILALIISHFGLSSLLA